MSNLFPFLYHAVQGLLAKEGSTHIGIRATTYSAEDFHDSDAMGIATLTAEASILKARLKAALRILESQGKNGTPLLHICSDKSLVHEAP